MAAPQSSQLSPFHKLSTSMPMVSAQSYTTRVSPDDLAPVTLPRHNTQILYTCDSNRALPYNSSSIDRSFSQLTKRKSSAKALANSSVFTHEKRRRISHSGLSFGTASSDTRSADILIAKVRADQEFDDFICTGYKPALISRTERYHSTTAIAKEESFVGNKSGTSKSPGFDAGQLVEGVCAGGAECSFGGSSDLRMNGNTSIPTSTPLLHIPTTVRPLLSINPIIRARPRWVTQPVVHEDEVLLDEGEDGKLRVEDGTSEGEEVFEADEESERLKFVPRPAQDIDDEQDELVDDEVSVKEEEVSHLEASSEVTKQTVIEQVISTNMISHLKSSTTLDISSVSPSTSNLLTPVSQPLDATLTSTTPRFAPSASDIDEDLPASHFTSTIAIPYRSVSIRATPRPVDIPSSEPPEPVLEHSDSDESALHPIDSVHLGGDTNHTTPLPLTAESASSAVPDVNRSDETKLKRLECFVELPSFRQTRKAAYVRICQNFSASEETHRSDSSPASSSVNDDYGSSASTDSPFIEADEILGVNVRPTSPNEKKKTKKRKRNDRVIPDMSGTPNKRPRLESNLKSEYKGADLTVEEMLSRGRETSFHDSWLKPRSTPYKGGRRDRAIRLKRCQLLAGGYRLLLKRSPNNLLRRYVVCMRPDNLGEKYKHTIQKVHKLVSRSGGSVIDDQRQVAESSDSKAIIITDSDGESQPLKAERNPHSTYSMDLLQFLLWYDRKYTKFSSGKVSDQSTLTYETSTMIAEALDYTLSQPESHDGPRAAKTTTTRHVRFAPIPEDSFYGRLDLRSRQIHPIESRGSYQTTSRSDSCTLQPSVSNTAPSNSPVHQLDRAHISLETTNSAKRDPAQCISSLLRKATGHTISNKWLARLGGANATDLSQSRRSSVREHHKGKYELYRIACFELAFNEMKKWVGYTDILKGHAVRERVGGELVRLKRESSIGRVTEYAGGQIGDTLAMIDQPIWIHDVKEMTELEFYQYVYRLYRVSSFLPEEIAMHLP
ncbi:uncharacterized protein I206_107062 [Kwoniella pini CBS 10737]|uniref:Uncharacterized protein n=1 Tax=Kwoniella pini CBS 10737 TaxID=1296096 RepID=A0A1B9HZB9_9TREE|nr:uncharacterized protein I206_05395 [Kwoniella pini CBS 10737]OCF48615.1 hypothetical protein I206_05395 [Kwoniella pini CBS 10737]